jgi:hypothetical protein
MGTGEVLADLSLINVKLFQGSDRGNFLANGQFEDLKANFKYPVNVSLGASRQLGNVRLFGSLQWYGSIDEYKVVDPQNAPFIQPPTDDNVLYTSDATSAWSSNKAILNGSVAMDWRINPTNHLLMSFRTDHHYSSFDPTVEGNNLAVKQWDNYHFTIGTQRELKSSIWLIGLRYNYGRNKNFPQPASFTDPSEGNFLQGNRATGNIVSTGLQLMLSYTFKFGNK